MEPICIIDSTLGPNESQALEATPQLTERMLIDLLNGLEVSGELIRFKEGQQRLARLMTWLDGSSARRDAIIEMQHQQALETLTTMLHLQRRNACFLAESIIDLAQMLKQTHGWLKTALKSNLRLKKEFDELRGEFEQRSHQLTQDVARIDLQVRAIKRRDQVLAAWESERCYHGYPPLAQAVLAIGDLSLGIEGHRLLSEQRDRELICDLILVTLKRKFGIARDLYLPLRVWMAQYVRPSHPLRCDIISYLFSSQGDAPLHNLLADFAETATPPIWLGVLQAQGFPVFFRTDKMIEWLLEEAARRN